MKGILQEYGYFKKKLKLIFTEFVFLGLQGTFLK